MIKAKLCKATTPFYYSFALRVNNTEVYKTKRRWHGMDSGNRPMFLRWFVVICNCNPIMQWNITNLKWDVKNLNVTVHDDWLIASHKLRWLNFLSESRVEDVSLL